MARLQSELQKRAIGMLQAGNTSEQISVIMGPHLEHNEDCVKCLGKLEAIHGRTVDTLKR